MIMIIVIVLLSGLIKQVSLIQCYTCSESGYHCPLPLNLDGGDESNENDIETFNYDSDYACLSDHSLNPSTGEEKLILRGIHHCKELNIPNRRVHCCYTNYCNKQLPLMTVQTLADAMPVRTLADAVTVRTLADAMADENESESNSQRYISSIILIGLSIIFQYIY